MNKLKKIISIVTISTFLFTLSAGTAGALTAEELQVQITALMAQLATLQTELAVLQGGTGATVTGCTITSFDRALKLTMTGDDVKCLQIVLNSDSATIVASSGVGSSGNETSYFGPLTKTAAIKFQEKYASEILESWGLTAGTGYIGSTTRAKLNTMLSSGGVVTPVVPTAAGLTVALSALTPATGVVITSGDADPEIGQALTPFTTVNFTAGSEGSVTVTTLKFKRIGISADANFDNVYLYEGTAKLIEGGTISSTYITFNDATGIFTVPAGQTKSITLKANLNYDVSAGKTMSFNLVAATDITSDASAVNGTFPISGKVMSVANATDFGYVTLTRGAVPSVDDTNVNPQDDYEVWRVTVQANNQNLEIERLVFTEVGSIQSNDLQNFKLYYGGTLLGTAEMDSNYQVIFDLSASPFSMTKGTSKILKLYANIVKGSTRTFKFTLQYPTDFIAKDANYGVYVPAYTGGTWSVIQPVGNYKIAAGSMSVTKATDSPTGNVALDSTNVTLAKYDFKAVGEDIKISTLGVTAATSIKNGGLDNGKIYLDGVQVGSTKDLTEEGETPTSFTFGTSFVVPAGTTGVVEIKADIKTATSTSLATAETITIYLEEGTDNAQGQSSLTVLAIPATDKLANALTVQAGSLTFTISSAYGAQNTVKPATEFKIGSFSMLAGSTEGVSIDSITIVFDSTEKDYMENLRLKVGADEIGSIKVTPSTSNLFSVNVPIAKGGSKMVDVYADILADASTITPQVYGTGTTVDTSVSVAAGASDDLVALQTISVAISSLTLALASDALDASILTGQSTDVELAKYTFSSLYEGFTVSEVKIETLPGTDDNIVGLYLKYKNAAGETVTSSVLPLIDREANFVTMTFDVPANTDANLAVYGNLNSVASAGYADTGDQPQLSLTYYKASSGSQSSYTGPSTSEYNNVTLSAASTAGAVTTWSTEKQVGSYSALIDHLIGASGSAYVEFSLSSGMTVADLDDITSSPEWSFWYLLEDVADDWGPHMELRFTDPDSNGYVDVTIMALQGTSRGSSADPTLDAWAKYTVLSTTKSVNYYGNAPDDAAAFDGGGSGTALDEIEALIDAETEMTNGTAASAANWVLTRVRMELWENIDRDCNIDDVTINGITYAIEPMVSGNQMVLYKTKPVVALTSTYSTIFTNGTNVLYPFTVAADAKGDIGLKILVFNITTATNDVGDRLNTFKFYRGSDDITDEVTITGGGTLTGGAGSLEGTTYYYDGTDTATTTVTFATEEIITEDTSQTYYLKANATGIGTVGDSVQTYLQDDSAYDPPEDKPGDVLSGNTPSFVWTDRSVVSAYHSEDESAYSVADWLNGYLVETLPGETVTLSK